MEIKVRTKGIPQIIAVLNKANKNLKPEVMKIAMEAMVKTVEESKAETERRGWKLADTIMITEISPEQLMVQGSVLASYAGFPEFGTVKYHARPYWMPFVWSNFYEMQEKLYELQRRLFSP